MHGLLEKKGQAFMSFFRKQPMIENHQWLDHASYFDDSDDTACGAIYKAMATVVNGLYHFANGGDRNKDNIPELKTYKGIVEFAFGVGGDVKLNSFSTILENWKQP